MKYCRYKRRKGLLAKATSQLWKGATLQNSSRLAHPTKSVRVARLPPLNDIGTVLVHHQARGICCSGWAYGEVVTKEKEITVPRIHIRTSQSLAAQRVTCLSNAKSLSS